MNAALMTIAQARVAEIRQAAERRSGLATGHVVGIPAEIRVAAATAGSRRPVGARRTIGWFLVRIGLRLAQPRSLAGSVR